MKQQREMSVLQQIAYQQQQTQQYAAQMADGVNAGSKRDLDRDDTFEGFLADMKKRKVAPMYDSGEYKMRHVVSDTDQLTRHDKSTELAGTTFPTSWFPGSPTGAFFL